jgi:transcriptional regulator with XRE-family HTH domain
MLYCRLMRKPRTYSPLTVEAARLLGSKIRAARRERRWTVEDLAERVGVNHGTIRKVERGDLTVGLGVAFEAAALLGIALFDDDPGRRSLEAARVADRLAVLPERVRRPARVDNDF